MSYHMDEIHHAKHHHYAAITGHSLPRQTWSRMEGFMLRVNVDSNDYPTFVIMVDCRGKTSNEIGNEIAEHLVKQRNTPIARPLRPLEFRSLPSMQNTFNLLGNIGLTMSNAICMMESDLCSMALRQRSHDRGLYDVLQIAPTDSYMKLLKDLRTRKIRDALRQRQEARRIPVQLDSDFFGDL